MMNELDRKMNELDKENADIAKKYFSNGTVLQQMFDVVRKKLEISEPMGNYDSDIMIFIDDDLSLNNEVINMIKKFYDVNNKNMYDVYITSVHKTSNDKINSALAQKEIQILKPKRIIYLGVEPSNKNSHFISKVELDIFKKSIGHADLINTQEYVDVKNKFIKLMKYIITGVD